MGTRTAQGLTTYWARLEPLLPTQICDEVRFCRLDKTFQTDVKRVTLNIVSPEKRLLVLKALGQTEAERKYGRAPPTAMETPEDVKIMVKTFFVKRGVQRNSKAWHNAMQSEHTQRMVIVAKRT